MNKKIVIKVHSIKKLIIVSILICMILSVALFGNIFAGNETDIKFNNYNIESGDTMWSIAASITPENKDIREVVYEIEKLNHKKSNEIKPGDRLYLPVYK